MNMNLSSLHLPPNPVIIDCGCNEGQWLDHVLPQFAGRPRVIAIDMLYEEAKRLQLKTAMPHKSADVTVLNCALSNAATINLMGRTAVISRHECSQSSSLLAMTELHNKVWGSPTHKPVGFELNDYMLLDHIVTLLMIDHVDLLKLDLQGYELQALRGAEMTLDMTDHVLSEISWVELYEGQVLYPELNKFLEERGFECMKFFDLRRMPDDSGPACGDALWSRVR